VVLLLALTLCKLKGDRVADMNTVGRRTTAGIKEKRLAALVAVENKVEVAVGEDNASPEEAMGLLARHPLKPLEQRIVDSLGSKFVHQLVVVDRLDDSVLADLTGHLSCGIVSN